MSSPSLLTRTSLALGRINRSQGMLRFKAFVCCPWCHRAKWSRRCAKGGAILVALMALVGIAFGVLMRQGPLHLDGLPQEVSKALTERLQAGWSAQVGDASLAWGERGLGLEARFVKIINPQGHAVVSAPQAFVDVDTWGLFTGRFRPRAIGFSRLDLRLDVGNDGLLTWGGAPSALDKSAQTKILETPPLALPENSPTLTTSLASALGGILTAEGVFGSLDSVVLDHARILLVDPQERQSIAFEDVSIAFETVSDVHKRIRLNVDSAKGGWIATGAVIGRKGKARQIQIGLEDININDLLLLSGQAQTPQQVDARITGQINVHVSPNDEIGEADIDVQTRLKQAKVLSQKLSHSDDIFKLKGRWNTQERLLMVEALEASTQALSGVFKGQLKQDTTGQWNVDVSSNNLTIKPAQTLAKLAMPAPSYLVDQATLKGRFAQNFKSGDIETQLRIGEGQVRLNARVSPDPTYMITSTLQAQHMPLRQALSLWPQGLSKWTRHYLQGAFQEGTLDRLDLTYQSSWADMLTALEEGGAKEEDLKGSLSFSQAQMQIAEGLAPLTQMKTNASFTGRRFELGPATAVLILPNNHRMNLEEGILTIRDTLPERPIGVVSFKLKGAAVDLMSLLSSPALKDIVQLELEPKGMSGQADVKVNLTLPLSQEVKSTDIQAQAQGSLTGIGMDKAFGDEKLEDGRFSIVLDRQGLGMKGEGKVGGLAAHIELKPATKNSVGEASASFVLDEAQQAKRGLNVSAFLKGSLGVKIIALVTRTPQPQRVEVDLTKAAIDGLIPGWTKPLGKAGKISFNLIKEVGQTRLEKIMLESQGVLAKGQAEFGKSGNLESLTLETLKISPGDDMKVDVVREGNLNRVVVKGSVIDARPFLQMLTASSGTKPNSKPHTHPFGDLDLTLNTPILAGHNQEAMTNVNLAMMRTGGALRQLKFIARQGKVNINADILKSTSQAPMLVMQSGDAGATLRFFDVYRRMIRGDLVFQLSPLEGRQRGEFLISDFALRQEPALKRILTESPSGSAQSDRVSQLPQGFLDSQDVQFDTLKADFQRVEGRYDIREAVITGPQVGFNIQGMIDFPKNRLDVTGTFVPAYGLNNVFSQVPVFGQILGGDKNEGLFAINFHIAGALSAPTLIVNPLSAIAPGIFRKLFGAKNTTDNPTTQPRGIPRER
jgi:hypothetical protein